MNYIDMINDIEDKKCELTEDNYYHAFFYEKDEFISMINDGIKSRLLLHKESVGYNGLFYVSLMKEKECEYSIYKKLYHLPMFIINHKINAIKTNNYKIGRHSVEMFESTPLPFRGSVYDDEYQKFLKVSEKDIIGIVYNIYHNYINNGDIKDDLIVLRSIVEVLNEQESNLLIIDKSSNKFINKNKVLYYK